MGEGEFSIAWVGGAVDAGVGAEDSTDVDSGVGWAFSAPLGASKDLNKSNKPKDSKIKNLQNLKFYGKIRKKSGVFDCFN